MNQSRDQTAEASAKPAAGGSRVRGLAWSVFAGVCAAVVGVYACTARSGRLELLASRTSETYYNLLVQGFRAGHVSIARAAPPGLAQLSDPYDPVANLPYRWSDRDPLDDLSYYQGKLYLYFGVTPPLVLFWPYAALTGHYLLHKEAVVIFCAVGFLASAGLLWGLWRRYFPEASVGIVAAGALALGLAAGGPVFVAHCDVHEVAVSCAYALTMLALGALWQAWHDLRRRTWWLAAASLAYGLAVGARPSVLPGAVILLLPVAWAWRAGGQPGSRRTAWPLLGAAITPIALVGLGLMAYNTARFDNPFEFGWRYQLGGFRQDRGQFLSWHYLWFNFRLYFLEPTGWSRYFPYVERLAHASAPAGHAGLADRFGGILVNLPVTWLALAAPLSWRHRPAESGSTLRWFLGALALLFGIRALFLCFFYAAFTRYDLDFVPCLLLLAVAGILGLERALSGRWGWRQAARWGWGLLLVYSVALNLLAGVKRHVEVRSSFAYVLMRNGRLDEAITYFKEGVERQPHDANLRYTLAMGLLQQGRPEEAAVEFQKALEIQPGLAEAHYALARLLLQQGRFEEAALHLRRGLELQPGNASAHNNLGGLLLRMGRVEEARGQFETALRIKPDYALAQNNLGSALLQAGRVDEAVAHFRKALELQPRAEGFSDNLRQAAWVWATHPQVSVRNGSKALELAGQLNQLSGGTNVLILSAFAAASAEAGRFAEAVATAQAALRLATAQNNPALSNALRLQLEQYQAGTPWRDASLAGTEPGK